MSSFELKHPVLSAIAARVAVVSVGFAAMTAVLALIRLL